MLHCVVCFSMCARPENINVCITTTMPCYGPNPTLFLIFIINYTTELCNVVNLKFVYTYTVDEIVYTLTYSLTIFEVVWCTLELFSSTETLRLQFNAYTGTCKTT